MPAPPEPGPLPVADFDDGLHGYADLDADYDALVPEDSSFDDENTSPRRSAVPEPGSLPPPDFIGDTDDPFESVAHGSNLDDDLGVPDGGELDDGQLAAFAPPGAFAEPAAPAPAEPVYEVDDALEEALEEADFFVSQDLFDDALSLLEEQIPRYPGHPLLIERMQSVRAAMRDKQGG